MGEYHKRIRGFALMDIPLIVLIIGAVAVMIVPRLTGRSDEAKEAAAQADIKFRLSTALKLYDFDNGHFPTTDQGLNALVRKPETPPVPLNWNGPYIEKPPFDPWGRPYIYFSPGENRMDYDLSSDGKDMDSGEDDIVNWR